MNLSMKIDTREEHTEVKDELLLHVLMPKQDGEAPDEKKILENALDHPIGTRHLEEIVHPGEKVVIITSDNTRPLPSYKVLPPVLSRLTGAGIQKSDIQIIFARGSHRKETPAEQAALVGQEVYDTYHCSDSDPEHTFRYGETKAGTPVDIDARIHQADRVICLGNVEYHYFAGFSGGAKAIMPGCSTRAAIEKNHRFMVRKEACAGRLTGNPVREDLEEAASMVHADFIVNVVLDTKKQIVYAAAGDMTKAHRDACKHLVGIYAMPIEEQADIVIVSQGGAPKDRNLYQTQKALDNAGYAVKKGGTVIVCGSCKEGFGEEHFENFMKTYQDPEKMVQALYHHFVLGAHKAAAIALVQERAEIYLVSDLPDEIVNQTFLKPFHTLAEAYAAAQEKYGHKGTVIAMPYGGSTLPQLKREKEE